ncbi:hypothetical protein [Nonomuraea polychroma]|uniref:hypothetical protein n=1 Tax=Nonomuraea polychroma TaxID=46176 RepID=UPI000FDDC8CB|nr:hypothetical protein [Nonomuraea polychroma]
MLKYLDWKPVSTKGERLKKLEQFLLDQAMEHDTPSLLFHQAASRFGTATLTVTGGPATPSSPKPQRTATTTITLTQARVGAWRAHPKANDVRIDVSGLDERVFQLTVTHEFRLPDDDPDVAALRAGAAGYSLTPFVEDRVGNVGMNPESGAVLYPAFTTPTTTVERGSGLAIVTFTGIGYGKYETDDYVAIDFSPASGEGVLPFSAHEIVITAEGWTVAGVTGPPPLTQDRHYLRLDGYRSMRAAFVRNGHTASVAGYLARDDEIGQRAEVGREGEQEEELRRSDFDFRGRAAAAVEPMVYLGVSLAIVY